jgi:hypothetical protein
MQAAGSQARRLDDRCFCERPAVSNNLPLWICETADLGGDHAERSSDAQSGRQAPLIVPRDSASTAHNPGCAAADLLREAARDIFLYRWIALCRSFLRRNRVHFGEVVRGEGS